MAAFAVAARWLRRAARPLQFCNFQRLKVSYRSSRLGRWRRQCMKDWFNEVPFYKWPEVVQEEWMSWEKREGIEPYPFMKPRKSFPKPARDGLRARFAPVPLAWQRQMTNDGVLNSSGPILLPLSEILEKELGCQVTMRLGGSGSRYTDTKSSDSDIYFDPGFVVSELHRDRLLEAFQEQLDPEAHLSGRGFAIQLEVNGTLFDLLPASSTYFDKSKEEFPLLFGSSNRSINDNELRSFYGDSKHEGARLCARHLRSFFGQFFDESVKLPNLLLDQIFRRYVEPGVKDRNGYWTTDIFPREGFEAIIKLMTDLADYAGTPKGALMDLHSDISALTDKKDNFTRALLLMSEIARQPVRVNRFLIPAKAMYDPRSRPEICDASLPPSPYSLYMRLGPPQGSFMLIRGRVNLSQV